MATEGTSAASAIAASEELPLFATLYLRNDDLSIVLTVSEPNGYTSKTWLNTCRIFGNTSMGQGRISIHRDTMLFCIPRTNAPPTLPILFLPQFQSLRRSSVHCLPVGPHQQPRKERRWDGNRPERDVCRCLRLGRPRTSGTTSLDLSYAGGGPSFATEMIEPV